MNILIILSNSDRSLAPIQRIIQSSSGVRTFLICPVNFDLDDTAQKLAEFIRSKTSSGCEIIPFSKYLLDHSLKVKDPFLAFISALGERYVPPGVKFKESFRYYSQKFSLWWPSLVYEKNPSKTDTYLHFVKLSLVAELQQKHGCQEIWMSAVGVNAKYAEVLSSARNLRVRVFGPRKKSTGFGSNLKLIVREWLRSMFYISFLKKVRVWVHGFGFRKRPRLPNGCHRFVVTMFPFFDQQKFHVKKFYSKAYGPLQDGLEGDGHPFAWLAMPIKIEPHTPKDTVRLMKEVQSFTPNLFSIDQWIGWRDIGRIAGDFFVMSGRFYRIFPRCPELTEYALAPGINVRLWPIMREDFITSFAGKVLVVNLHYLRAFLNIARSLPPDSTIIHFAEMQNWERCLQIACRLRGDVNVVALQHAHVPQLLLNYFDDADDLKPKDLIQSVPQPSFLGSVGLVIQDYFLRQGWAKEKLFVIGGFRFQSLVQPAPAQKLDREHPSIVAAFSICYNENLEMLKMLQKAYNRTGTKLRIYLKSHPAESAEKMARREKLDLDRSTFIFTDEPLEALMPKAAAMFACSTSATFYAIACRRPVLVPHLYDAVDLCPLTNVYKYETRVANHQELHAAVDKILSGRYDETHQEAICQKLINQYLCLDKDSRRPFNNLKKYLNK